MGHGSSSFELIAGGAELLARVGPLWERLRDHHAAASERWSGQLRATTFAARRDGLVAKGVHGLHVELAVSDGHDVGYCVSTVRADREGEVDSLFVADTHRRLGVGRAMMLATLSWFDAQSVAPVTLEVLIGNEVAIPFYESLGFYARTTRMMRAGQTVKPKE